MKTRTYRVEVYEDPDIYISEEPPPGDLVRLVTAENVIEAISRVTGRSTQSVDWVGRTLYGQGIWQLDDGRYVRTVIAA